MADKLGPLAGPYTEPVLPSHIPPDARLALRHDWLVTALRRAVTRLSGLERELGALRADAERYRRMFLIVDRASEEGYFEAAPEHTPLVTANLCPLLRGNDVHTMGLTLTWRASASGAAGLSEALDQLDALTHAQEGVGQ